MKLSTLIIAVIGCLSVASTVAATDTPDLAPQLEPLRPLLEKTWRGAFKNTKPDKPVVDVSHWERALNGKAIRVLHSINNGVYGGETIFTWDEKKQAVTYHYFTTDGFMTEGTLTFKDKQILTHEVVSGDTGGVTEVRGTSEILLNGTFHVKTEYLKNGNWTVGREVEYTEDSNARVVFK
jgi:hypothetical protein